MKDVFLKAEQLKELYDQAREIENEIFNSDDFDEYLIKEVREYTGIKDISNLEIFFSNEVENLPYLESFKLLNGVSFNFELGLFNQNSVFIPSDVDEEELLDELSSTLNIDKNNEESLTVEDLLLKYYFLIREALSESLFSDRFERWDCSVTFNE